MSKIFLPEKIPHLGKFRFLNCEPKFFKPIRLQDSSIRYTSREKLMSQLEFWHADMDSRNVKDGFINQPYLKSTWVNQLDYLHADTDCSKVKVDLMTNGELNVF